MPEENGFATATLRIELWKTLDVNNYVKLNRSMRRSGWYAVTKQSKNVEHTTNLRDTFYYYYL